MDEKIASFYAELGFKINDGDSKKFKQMANNTIAHLKALRQHSMLQASEARKVGAEERAQIATLRRKQVEENLLEKAEKKRSKSRIEGLKGVRNAMLGIIAAGYTLSRVTRETRELGLSYRTFQAQTGLPLSELQQWERAAYAFGSSLSSQDIIKNIQSLNQELENIKLGKGSVFPFQLLGIDAAQQRNAFDVLEAIRDRIEGLDNPTAVNLIKRFGLDEDFLFLLRQSREEFEKLNAVMLSNEQIDRVERLGMRFRGLEFAFRNFKDQLTDALGRGFLDNTVKNVSEIFDDISKTLKELELSPEMIAGITTAFGLLLAAISPVTAAVTGLLLLFEHLWVEAKNGNKDVLEFLDATKTLIKALGTALSWTIKVLSHLGGVLSNLGKAFGGSAAMVVGGVTGNEKIYQEGAKVLSEAEKGVAENVGSLASGILDAGFGTENVNVLKPEERQFIQKLFNESDWLNSSLISDFVKASPAQRQVIINNYNNNTNNITSNVPTPEAGARFTQEFIDRNEQAQFNAVSAQLATTGSAQ